MSDLRSLPAVEQVLSSPKVQDLLHQYGRPIVTDAVRVVLNDFRESYGESGQLPNMQSIHEVVATRIQLWLAPTLVSVINATGVVLHTNLGRAPLCQSAIDAITETAGQYNTLEYDLRKGIRGSRLVHCESLLCRLSGAEAALVVNNNAAAVLLVLTANAKRKRVVISRTQLVEVGGGFRIPEVMAQSGAKLIEIGTTNRVSLRDYDVATDDPTAAIMRVHHSNFQIIGFTAEPTLKDLSELAHRKGTLLIDDLGSGTFIDTSRFGLSHEPTIQESLVAGADLITFSGDKLLGGPQAGIIIGKASQLDKIKKHPLARAVRADKLQLAALAATLNHYLKDDAENAIPVWRMISASTEELKARAKKWQEELDAGNVVSSLSTIGGGSLPEENLPTFVLQLTVPQPTKWVAKLRQQPIPIIARVENDYVLFDPRTVIPEQDEVLIQTLRHLL